MEKKADEPEEETKEPEEEKKVDYSEPIPDDVFGFNIWLSPDGKPYIESAKQRAYFHFSITGLPPATAPERRRVLRFRLKNTSNQARLLSYGHRPFACVLSPAQYRECYVRKTAQVC